jgi:hypothetical protein
MNGNLERIAIASMWGLAAHAQSKIFVTFGRATAFRAPSNMANAGRFGGNMTEDESPSTGRATAFAGAYMSKPDMSNAGGSDSNMQRQF